MVLKLLLLSMLACLLGTGAWATPSPKTPNLDGNNGLHLGQLKHDPPVTDLLFHDGIDKPDVDFMQKEREIGQFHFVPCPNPVPEPLGWIMLGLGLSGLAIVGFRPV